MESTAGCLRDLSFCVIDIQLSLISGAVMEVYMAAV